jgi:hypothetical protein
MKNKQYEIFSNIYSHMAMYVSFYYFIDLYLCIFDSVYKWFYYMIT